MNVQGETDIQNLVIHNSNDVINCESDADKKRLLEYLGTVIDFVFYWNEYINLV